MSNMPHFPSNMSKSRYLTPAQIEAFATELDAIRDEAMAKVGSEDAAYIRNVLATVRKTEIAGRGLLMTLGWLPPAWLAGVGLLGFSKIVENMELGHNVMHGQYDFMNDDALKGANYDWDNACAGPLWRHYHNYMHHTYTNIVGKDHDVGYDLVRICDEQPWQPSDIFNLPKTVVLALLFQWAVGYHDIQVSLDEYKDHPELDAIMLSKTRAMFKKMGRQITKDYVFFPAVATINAIPTFTGNMAANLIRNVWSFAIIFCGHFTADAEMFPPEYVDNLDGETRGEWYIRQIKGSSNISGGYWFHYLSGNLSHQIEHHLFPDMPALRYAEVAPKVQALCEAYGINYNTGNFTKQFGEVMLRIAKYSLPSKKDWRAYFGNSDGAGSDKNVTKGRFGPVAKFNKNLSIVAKDMMPRFIKRALGKY